MATIISQLILKISLVDVARQKTKVGILRGGVVSVMFYSSNHSHESSLKPSVEDERLEKDFEAHFPKY